MYYSETPKMSEEKHYNLLYTSVQMENNSYHPESENHTHTHDTSIQVTKEIQHPYILHTLNTHPKVTKINILGSYLVKGKKKLMRVQKAYVQVGYFKAGMPPYQ